MFSRRELLAGLTFLWGLPYLRTVLLVFGLGMNFAFGALTFTALTAFSDGGTSGVGGGFVLTCVSAGALSGALLAPRIRPARYSRVLIVATCWTCVAAAGVMAWISRPLVAGVLCALCMCLSTIASIGFLSKLLVVTPEDRVGRVQSAAGFLSSMVQPFGPLAGGALLTAFGARWAFALTGCVLAVSALVVTFARSARTEPSPEPTDRPEPGAGPAAGPDHAPAGAKPAATGD